MANGTTACRLEISSPKRNCSSYFCSTPYLYYVATEDPEINISRVENRVRLGGHPVPRQKVTERYYRSLELLFEAVRHTHRAYIFDNSFHSKVWLAEITDGNVLEMKSDTMPYWFEKALWDKFLALEDEGGT